MDPLSALSLAACIAQFIDFGMKIVRESKEIADTGSPVFVQNLKTLTSDLIDFNFTLGKQLTPLKAPNVSLGREEQFCTYFSLIFRLTHTEHSVF